MAGRPPKVFTEDEQTMIVRLSEIHCTHKEIAYVMGVSIDVIRKDENKELMEIGKAQGKIKLRKAQWRNALDNENVTMQIWLGKNMLGQTDQVVSEEDSIILPWED